MSIYLKRHIAVAVLQLNAAMACSLAFDPAISIGGSVRLGQCASRNDALKCVLRAFFSVASQLAIEESVTIRRQIAFVHILNSSLKEGKAGLALKPASNFLFVYG